MKGCQYRTTFERWVVKDAVETDGKMRRSRGDEPSATRKTMIHKEAVAQRPKNSNRQVKHDWAITCPRW